MNDKKHNIKFLFLLALFITLQNFQSQSKENVNYLGFKDRSFNLDKDCKEN